MRTFGLYRGMLALCFLVLVQCGQDTGPLSAEEQEASASASEGVAPSPFEGTTLGDDFGWGKFIRDEYQTATVKELPIPIYLAYFTPDEEDEISKGIDFANAAMGQKVFELVDTWDPHDRLIYKVHAIAFDESEAAGTDDFENVVGYTYSRNIYINDKYEAGRVVTDWAMEIKDGDVSRFVVAHELGHAMGIQKHALINYEKDSLEDLEPDSLMGAVIGVHPTFNDYDYMMKQQVGLLQQYMN